MFKFLSFIISFLIIFAIDGQTQITDTTEWTVFLGERKAGFLKKWDNTDGSYTEWFQFNDRGRGDSTVSHYRYDKEGFLTHFDAKGIDYFKKPIFERFKLETGIASWKNNAEDGQKRVNHKAYYVPLFFPPTTSYKYHFSTEDHRIQLLPTGSSKLTIHKEIELEKDKQIKLISITGADLRQLYIWIDEDAELFAKPGSWPALIRKGYESHKKELLEIQERYKDQFFGELARKHTHNIKSGIVIKNARLFDPISGKVHPEANIIIEDGRIKSVTHGPLKSPKKGYEIINADGRFVMPGLWDMHVHYYDHYQGLVHLASGVTNVRDMGNSTDLLDKKKQIEAKHVLGPRIQIMSGLIDGAGQYASPVGIKIKSRDEGIEAVREYAKLGYHQIKLYSSLDTTWVKPIINEAKKHNMRVSGHIPAYMLAEEAIEAGFNEIQHANMLFLNFYGKDIDTRTPERFTAVAKKAADFNFDSQEFKEFLQILKHNNVTIDPTVTIFEGMFIGKKGETTPSFKSVANRFPLNLQRILKKGSALQIEKGQEERFKKSFDSILKMVKVLYDNNITIVPGSDGFAGFTLHRELENYARAGIPNKEILKMATIISAKVAGKEEEFGSIEAGKIADLVIIDGDPTENMEDIRKIDIVIKDNGMYRTKPLLQAVSIKPYSK